jgi:hypothetical protein
METVCFSEALAYTDESTRRQYPEEHHHPHRRENCFDLIRKELAGLNLLGRPSNVYNADESGFSLNNKPPDKVFFSDSLPGKG